ncbi:MAG: response regulator [Proteobacteria bacterium]|nr:response regulator [Pseudomonadota bacterium]
MNVDATPLHAVHREQLALIEGHALAALLIGLATAVLLATYLGPFAPAPLVLGWLAAKLLLTVVRWRLLHSNLQRDSAPCKHAQLTLVLMGLDGLLWGVAGAWFAGHADPLVVAYVVGALACISCIATFGLQIYPLATAVYVAPVLLPMAAALALRLDRMGLSIAVGLMLLLTLQLLTARQAGRRLGETVRLRHEAEALAREKDEALALALKQSAAKSEFLGSVSHELRTPLHGMMGLARLVQGDTPPGRARRWLELIDASGRHLLALINDLLDAERGRVDLLTKLRLAPFELGMLVQEVIGMHYQRAREKGLVLTLEHTLRPGLWVQGDRRRVAQVLHNLLGNAIKFTPVGTVTLHVSRLVDDASLLCFTVTDTGPGIASADQARIFEAFTRTESAVGSEGTGLGLTIARDVARAMGGGLTVHSQPGHGAAFRFTARLPAVATPAPAQAPAQEPSATVPADAPLVLVAEDDDVNALITHAALDQLGLRQERVTDGRHAVARMQAGGTDRPHLVLMDCRMPIQDGYEATRQIRSHEYNEGQPRVPIIALTATATEDSRLECIQAGMDDFLSKPYSTEELATVVRAWLALARPE